MNVTLRRIMTRPRRLLLTKTSLFPRTPLETIFPETWKVFYDRGKNDPNALGFGALLWLTIILGEVAYALVHTAMNGGFHSIVGYP